MTQQDTIARVMHNIDGGPGGQFFVQRAFEYFFDDPFLAGRFYKSTNSTTKRDPATGRIFHNGLQYFPMPEDFKVSISLATYCL